MSVNPSDVRISVEPLWLPASGLDPSTYGDLYKWSGAAEFGTPPDLPLRAALSDARVVSPASQLWSRLLVDGYVVDEECTVAEIARNASVRSAVFVAQSAVSGLAADGTVGAGLLGLSVRSDGTATALAAGAYTLICIRADAAPVVREAVGAMELPVVGGVRRDQLQFWEFNWQAGDTILMCGRGVPRSMLSASASASWCGDTLPAFQGRVRLERARQPATGGEISRSATVLRLRLGS